MSLNQIKHIVIGFLAVAGSALTQLIGEWDTAMQTLTVLMAADFICGLIVAGVFKKSGKSELGALDSRASFKGLMRKVTIIFAVISATYLDKVLGDAAFTRTTVIMFFIANEGLSIVENMAIMGVPFPRIVRQALEQLKSENDDYSKE